MIPRVQKRHAVCQIPGSYMTLRNFISFILLQFTQLFGRVSGSGEYLSMNSIHALIAIWLGTSQNS